MSAEDVRVQKRCLDCAGQGEMLIDAWPLRDHLYTVPCEACGGSGWLTLSVPREQVAAALSLRLGPANGGSRESLGNTRASARREVQGR